MKFLLYSLHCKRLPFKAPFSIWHFTKAYVLGISFFIAFWYQQVFIWIKLHLVWWLLDSKLAQLHPTLNSRHQYGVLKSSWPSPWGKSENNSLQGTSLHLKNPTICSWCRSCLVKNGSWELTALLSMTQCLASLRFPLNLWASSTLSCFTRKHEKWFAGSYFFSAVFFPIVYTWDSKYCVFS